MKILVRDEGQSALGAIQVKIKDLSNELEKVTVRILRLDVLEKKILGSHTSASTKPSVPRKPAKSIPVIDGNAPPPTAATQPAAGKTVDVMLSLPSLSLRPALKKVRRLVSATPRRRQISALFCVIIIGAVVYLYQHPAAPHTNTTATSKSTPGLTRGDPSYATLLPAGKNIAELGGWARVSPPNRDPVYTYVDSIGGVRIMVSEQPLPLSFRTDTADKVAQLADSFNATEKFVAGGTIAYVGTSSQGPQSVILSKANLLILIKSANVLTTNQWAAYVNSLQ